MRCRIQPFHSLRIAVILFLAALPGVQTTAQPPVTLTVNADQPGAKIDPIFYGLMTEEINYSYDGGLYAVLIRNRIFQDKPIVVRRRPGSADNAQSAPANPAVAKNPNLVNWWLVADNGAVGEIDIDIAIKRI